jgi:hypothetical protein
MPPRYGPPPGRNGLAIVSLVLGIIAIVPVSIALAIAALVQTSRTRQKGRGLAIGGIAASCAWTVLAVLAIVWVVRNVGVERDAAGHVTRGGLVPIYDVKAGDCLRFHEQHGALIKVVPCSAAHDGEVIAHVPISPNGQYTSTEDVNRTTYDNCRQIVAATFTQDELRAASADPLSLFPSSQAASNGGFKQAVCMVVNPAKYTGTLRRLLKVPDSRAVPAGTWVAGMALQPGQCFDEMDGTVPDMVRVFATCTAPHTAQVVQRATLPVSEFPGEGTATARAEAACEEPVSRKVDTWTGAPAGALFGVVALAPTQEAWTAGDRTIVCAVESQPALTVAIP